MEEGFVMEVIQIKLKDIEKIVGIFDEYRVHFGKQSDLDGAKLFLTENIKENRSAIYAGIEDGKVIGFIQLYQFLSSLNMSYQLLINDLYLSRDARGKGLGVILMNSAFSHGESLGFDKIYLETEKSNIGGNKLYKKLDMKLDESHNYYSKHL